MIPRLNAPIDQSDQTSASDIAAAPPYLSSMNTIDTVIGLRLSAATNVFALTIGGVIATAGAAVAIGRMLA